MSSVRPYVANFRNKTNFKRKQLARLWVWQSGSFMTPVLISFNIGSSWRTSYQQSHWAKFSVNYLDIVHMWTPNKMNATCSLMERTLSHILVFGQQTIKARIWYMDVLSKGLNSLTLNLIPFEIFKKYSDSSKVLQKCQGIFKKSFVYIS